MTMRFSYLVDSSQWRHINSLSPDSSCTSNSGGVFPGARVDDGVDKDLEWVLASQKVDDLEAVLDNPDSQQLLAIVPAVHHQAVDQTLNNGAASLPEPLGGISKHKTIDNVISRKRSDHLTFQQSEGGTLRTSP